MNRREIDRLIPKAICLIQCNLLLDNKAPKELTGDISSFAASLRQAGLMATLAFFTEASTNEGSDLNTPSGRRSILLNKVIFPLGHPLEEGNVNRNKALSYAVAVNTNERYMLELKLENAAIAVKLALRAFPKTKKEEN